MRAFLVVVMLVVSVTACGSGDETDAPTAIPTVDVGTPAPTAAVQTTSPAATIEPLETLPPSPTEGPFEDRTQGPFAQVDLTDFAFSPERFVMVPEQGLTLRNTGTVLHSFTVPDTFIDFDVDPEGETNTEPVQNILPPGTYDFFCKYHRDQGMTGTFRISE